MNWEDDLSFRNILGILHCKLSSFLLDLLWLFHEALQVSLPHICLSGHLFNSLSFQWNLTFYLFLFFLGRALLILKQNSFITFLTLPFRPWLRFGFFAFRAIHTLRVILEMTAITRDDIQIKLWFRLLLLEVLGNFGRLSSLIVCIRRRLPTKTANCLVTKLLLPVNRVDIQLGRSYHLLDLLLQLSEFLDTRPPVSNIQLRLLSREFSRKDVKNIRVILRLFLKNFLVFLWSGRDFELFESLWFDRDVHWILE